MDRWKHRSADAIQNELARDLREIDSFGNIGIQAGESVAIDLAHVGGKTAGCQKLRQSVAHTKNVAGADRLREQGHHRYTPCGGIGRGRFTGAFDGGAYLARTQRDFNLAGFGAGNSQHQSRGIAEVAIKLYGSGALREIVDAFELGVYVVELLFGIGNVFRELDVNHRLSIQRDRGNAKVGAGPGRMDIRILGDLLFDFSRYQLLDLFGINAGPGADGDRFANWNLGIFALGHPRISKYAPHDNAHQQHPGERAGLDEESFRIASRANQLAVGPMRHQGITLTSAPSVTMVAPRIITRSPGFTPDETVISFPTI